MEQKPDKSLKNSLLLVIVGVTLFVALQHLNLVAGALSMSVLVSALIAGGDTTFGAYLAKRMMGVSIPDALLFATAAVSLKMESPGPLQGPEQAVLDYIKEFYA